MERRLDVENSIQILVHRFEQRTKYGSELGREGSTKSFRGRLKGATDVRR
jgi:hypothetical protein